MPRKVLANLSYANVTATLALFAALGGTGYAALKIGSGQVRDNSLRSKDIRNNGLRGKDLRRGTLTGREVRESRLGTVPRATAATRAEEATRVGGFTGDQLKLECPAGTVAAVGACFETAPRAADLHNFAAGACARDGRRLPTFGELVGLFQTQPPNLAPGGELTGNVFSPELTGDLFVVVMTNQTGANPEYIRAGVAGNERPYRCVVSPS